MTPRDSEIHANGDLIRLFIILYGRRKQILALLLILSSSFIGLSYLSKDKFPYLFTYQVGEYYNGKSWEYIDDPNALASYVEYVIIPTVMKKYRQKYPQASNYLFNIHNPKDSGLILISTTAKNVQSVTEIENQIAKSLDQYVQIITSEKVEKLNNELASLKAQLSSLKENERPSTASTFGQSLTSDKNNQSQLINEAYSRVKTQLNTLIPSKITSPPTPGSHAIGLTHAFKYSISVLLALFLTFLTIFVLETIEKVREELAMKLQT